jgi:ParB family transcriptional regulator, chromosome partitioning protein
MRRFDDDAAIEQCESQPGLWLGNASSMGKSSLKSSKEHGEQMLEHTRKPLSFFKRDKNVRQKQRPEAERRELAKSLRERQLAPVWAKTDGTLLIGYGRLDAAEQEKLEALDVVITDEPLTEADILLIQAQENMLRQDLSDFEKVCIVERLQALCPKLMAKDIAERLHVDPAKITHLTSVSKVIPAVREAFEGGAITLSHVYELSKLEPRQQHELLPVAINGGSRDAISTERRKRRNGNGSSVRLNRVKCPLRGATVIVTGQSIGLDEAIDAVLAAAKEMKRARDEGLDARVAQSVWEKRLKRSGSAEHAAVGSANS